MEIVNMIPAGFPVYNAETVAYVKDDKLYMNVPALNILVSDESDLTSLDNVPIGSVAYTADETAKWRLGIDGNWVQFVKVEETVDDNTPAEE